MRVKLNEQLEKGERIGLGWTQSLCVVSRFDTD